MRKPYALVSGITKKSLQPIDFVPVSYNSFNASRNHELKRAIEDCCNNRNQCNSIRCSHQIVIISVVLPPSAKLLPSVSNIHS